MTPQEALKQILNICDVQITEMKDPPGTLPRSQREVLEHIRSVVRRVPGFDDVVLRMNTVDGAHLVFGEGRSSPPLTYLGAPIDADFELSFEALAPYVVKVLDLAAPYEGGGHVVKRVEIKNGEVRVEV
jgi:hypothetical protein